MRTRSMIVILALLGLAGNAFAQITNLARIDELSQDSIMEADPCVSDDELSIYYYQLTSYSDPSADTIMQATRASTSEPFGSITSAPFANIVSATAFELDPWCSNDGLRLYFASDREGNPDLYVSFRASFGDPFSLPAKLSTVSSDIANDTTPRLANGELSLYFMSDRLASSGRVFRATRTSTSADFDTPVLVSEISDDYILFDVSEDELTLVLRTEGSLLYSQRSSTSEPFAAPSSVHIFSGSHPGDGTLSGDLSKIYIGQYQPAFPFPNPLTADLYRGDIELLPLPTPTPILPPEPVPEVKVVATEDQIATFTGGAGANPWGGAFDSQGRYVFFDQKVPIDATGTLVGTNQLIRLTPGSPPSFTTLATQAQLAIADDRWSGSTPSVELVDLATLSDDSVVLIGLGVNPQRLLRVVPGSPPQITVVGSIDLPSYDNLIGIVVDKADSPNTIYIGSSYTLYKIAADQLNGTPSAWFDLSPYYYQKDIAIDTGGNILFERVYGATLYSIDKITATTTEITHSFTSSLTGDYDYTLALEVNPADGEIFGMYYTSQRYPDTFSYFNLYRIPNEADLSGRYTPENFAIEEQILGDPDLSGWYTTGMNFILPGRGMAIHPSGHVIYCSNGRHRFLMYAATRIGTQCIISIGTSELSRVPAAFWRQYR